MPAALAILSEIGGQLTAGVPGAGPIVYGATRAGGAIKHRLQTRLAKATNIQYSNLVTATGKAREELIRGLEDRLTGPKQSILRRVSTAVSRLPIAP